MLKNLLLKQKIKKKHASTFQFSAYDQIDTIGIIFPEGESEAGLSYLRNELKLDGKEIKLLMRLRKFDKEKTYDFPFFVEKDIGLTGNIESTTLKDFIDAQIEMLLVLDSSPDVCTTFVVSKCNALKIGFFQSEMPIEHLDLLVKPTSASSKYQDLVAYLRKVA